MTHNIETEYKIYTIFDLIQSREKCHTRLDYKAMCTHSSVSIDLFDTYIKYHHIIDSMVALRPFVLQPLQQQQQKDKEKLNHIVRVLKYGSDLHRTMKPPWSMAMDILIMTVRIYSNMDGHQLKFHPFVLC